MLMQLSINCRIGLRLELQPPPLATKPNFVAQTYSSVAMVRTTCRRYCMPPMTDSINRDACTINLLIFQYHCDTILTFILLPKAWPRLPVGSDAFVTFCSFVTKHACDRRTDRGTDRQNYDSHDHANIAASCSINCRPGCTKSFQD